MSKGVTREKRLV